MAFHKVSTILLVLLVYLAIISDARIVKFDSSLKFHSSGDEESTSCQCTEKSGVTKCIRSWSKKGGFPSACTSFCGCTLILPSELMTCFCRYEVESCDSVATAKLENLVATSKLENLLVH